MIEIHSFRADHPRFHDLLNRNSSPDPRIVEAVTAIVDSVRTRGDEALYEYMRKFDQIDLSSKGSRVSDEEIDTALRKISPAFLEALQAACENIRRYHEHQRPANYSIEGPYGEVLERHYWPIESVGVCIPGASAPLSSSLYMNLVPAQVAGVPRLVIISAPRNGRVDPHILAVAAYLGVREIHAISGAQGVAALAYGTESIPKVDKIVGPGNIWVATAKRLVYGAVGVDSLAGPSEIVVIADESANPRLIAIDLLSQAEHGTGLEASVAFVASRAQAEEIRQEVAKLSEQYGLTETVKPALDRYGAIFVVDDLEIAVQATGRMAPEHAELVGPQAEAFADRLTTCGALFLGDQTPEPVGDYYAGSNHVLPTQGTARFSSGLTVTEFMRSSSRVRYNSQALAHAAPHIAALADAEQMKAHRLAVQLRLEQP